MSGTDLVAGDDILDRQSLSQPNLQALATTLRFSLNFGNTVLFDTVTKQVVLTNKVGRDLVVIGIGIAGEGPEPPDFDQTNDCPAILAVSASCAITISFHPTALDVRNGILSIVTDAPDSPLFLGLTGNGVPAIPAVLLEPPNLDFGSQITGRTSLSQPVTLTNSGTAPLVISSVAIGDGFRIASTACPAAPAGLGRGKSCVFEVTCSPTVAGPLSGLLTVQSNAPSLTDSVSLVCSGVPPGPVLVIGAPFPAFGSVVLGKVSDPHAFTFTNTGIADLLIDSIAIDNPEFSIVPTSSCPISPRSLGPGLSCSVSITFAPAVEGLRLGTMSIFSNAPGSPHTVALSGRGTRFGDPVPGRWTETDRMGFERGRGHTATRLRDGKVLVVGGTFGITAFETAELYDPLTGQWQRTGSMHVPRRGHTATLLNNGKVLVAGGCSCTLFTNEPTAEIYDPATRTWTATGNEMNEESQSFFRARAGHTATLLDNGHVLVAGGSVVGTAPPQTWGTSETYDPDADRWSPACSMDYTGFGYGRSFHTATLMPDGRVLAVGGFFNGFPLDSVEVFNPAATCTAQTPQSLVWARLPATMNFAHGGHTAALLNTGHVLVAGGGAGFGNQSVSELLDPVTGKWIVTGELNVPRGEHQAVTLENGQVLIAGGGISGTAEDNAVAEIYTPGTHPDPAKWVWSRTASMNAVRSIISLTRLDPTVDATGVERILAVGAGSVLGAGRLSCTSAEIYTGGTSPTTPRRAPSLQLVPNPLMFPALGLGLSSAPQTATLSYSCFEPMTINTIGVAPVEPQDFAQTNNCPSTLAAGTSCAIDVTFTPAAVGGRKGTLTAGTSAGKQAVSLQGTGLTNFPSLVVNPTAIEFAKQPVGVGATQSVTLTNFGLGLLNLAAITITPLDSDFTVNSSCPTTLASTGSCFLTVGFIPRTVGPQTATIIISTNAAVDAEQKVILTGEGVDVVISPGALSFGVHPVGSISAAQLVTVANSFLGPLTLIAATLEGDFALDATDTRCITPGTLVSGQSCSYAVRFAPIAGGLRAGALTIVTSRSSVQSSHSILLQGIGAEPKLCFSNTLVAFADQPPHTTSREQSIALSNCGTADLHISSVSTLSSVEFTVTNFCPTLLSPGARCALSLTFTPAALGLRTGTLVVGSDAADSVSQVRLSGRGVDPTDATASLFVDFGGHPLGTTSSPETIVITNTTGTSLRIFSITTNSDFKNRPTCPLDPATLGVEDTCSIVVTFTPRELGLREGTLSISSTNGLEGIGLRGTGLGSPVVLSSTSLSFGDQTVGTTSAVKSVTLTNRGITALTIREITVTGTGFAQSNNCGISVAAHDFCTISVSFSPNEPGPAEHFLVITTDAPDSPHQVTLTGNGVRPFAPEIFIVPLTVDFADQPIGTTSAARLVRVTNTGTAPLTLSGIAMTSTEFAATSDCAPGTVEVGFSCFLNVTFTPAAAGVRVADLVILDNAAGSPHNISLLGNGVATPAVSLNTVNLDFGAQFIGFQSGPQAVTLSNSGTAVLQILATGITGEFIKTDNCPPALPAGNSCVFQVTFAPSQVGAGIGVLSITSSAAGSPHTVALSGKGVIPPPPAVTLNPTALDFGEQIAGTISAPLTVVLTNNGAGPLLITGLTISGAFSVFHNCPLAPASLGAGLSCQFQVIFAPTQKGNDRGSLTITSNAPGSPHTVKLKGKGRKH